MSQATIIKLGPRLRQVERATAAPLRFDHMSDDEALQAIRDAADILKRRNRHIRLRQVLAGEIEDSLLEHMSSTALASRAAALDQDTADGGIA